MVPVISAAAQFYHGLSTPRPALTTRAQEETGRFGRDDTQNPMGPHRDRLMDLGLWRS